VCGIEDNRRCPVRDRTADIRPDFVSSRFNSRAVVFHIQMSGEVGK
jgi:hypothetical protein